MERTRLTEEIRSLIVKAKKKHLFFGCRKLSLFLKQNYNLSLSKSSINKVLVSHGFKESVGKKSEVQRLIRKSVDHCGLLFLKAALLDLNSSLIFKESLASEFPKFSAGRLFAFIEYFLYARFVGIQNLDDLRRYKGRSLWKILSLNRPISEGSAALFLRKFNSLAVKEKLIESTSVNFRMVKSLRLIFKDNTSVYLDPEFRSFWSDSSDIPLRLYEPFSKVKARLGRILKADPLVLMGISCFSKFPASFEQFIKGFSSGIDAIEVISPDEAVVERITVDKTSLKFIIGFYPRQLKDIADFKEEGIYCKLRTDSIRKDINFCECEVKYKYTQPVDIGNVVLRNVLMKCGKTRYASWGLFTNITDQSLDEITAVYSISWPYLDEGFNRHLKVVESWSMQPSESELAKKLSSLGDNEKADFFLWFIDFLKAYLLEKFFPGDTSLSELDWEFIFTIKGRLAKRTRNFSKVFLTLPKQSSFYDVLKAALPFINESDIYWNKRKLAIFLT